MTEELRERFNAAHKVFSEATINYSVGRRARNWEMETSGQKALIDETLKTIITEVERAVQTRLHYHEA
jgi:hypothetical protein